MVIAVESQGVLYRPPTSPKTNPMMARANRFRIAGATACRGRAPTAIRMAMSRLLRSTDIEMTLYRPTKESKTELAARMPNRGPPVVAIARADPLDACWARPEAPVVPVATIAPILMRHSGSCNGSENWFRPCEVPFRVTPHHRSSSAKGTNQGVRCLKENGSQALKPLDRWCGPNPVFRDHGRSI